MRGTKIAARYAQSLLELAQERKEEEVVAKDMLHLSNSINESRELAVFLASPIINASKKNEVFEALFSDFAEISKGFIRLITKNGREAYLPVIADEYNAKFKAAQGIIPVTVTSAQKLDDTVKSTILSKLEGKVNGKFEVTEKIDESLIGGFVFRMGDTQIEGSVARQLKELKQRLTR